MDIKKYWDELTVQLDTKNIDSFFPDHKVNAEQPTVYVEDEDAYAFDFYNGMNGVDAKKMPVIPTPAFYDVQKPKPGLVASVLTVKDDVASGTPFVQIGGQFNELDVFASYFHVIALLAEDELTLAKQIAGNITYMVGHVHTLKPTNRSYHQHLPALPTYTSMVREIAHKIEDANEANQFLVNHIKRSILDYNRVWNQGDSKLNIGLNVYPNHSVEENSLWYDIANENRIPVRLNMMLYKTEVDIAHFISEHTDNGEIEAGDKTYNAEFWLDKANARKKLIQDLMWNEDKCNYFDLDTKSQEQIEDEQANFVYAFWSGVASENQVKSALKTCLPIYSTDYGFTMSQNSETSNGFEQMLMWKALANYGFLKNHTDLVENWVKLVESSEKTDSALPFSVNMKTGKAVANDFGTVFSPTVASYSYGKKLI